MRKIELYIPKVPTVPRAHVESAILAEWGGYTAASAEGAWTCPSTGLTITQPTTIYTVFAPDADPSVAYILEKIVEEYKAAAGQESVLYSIDGEGRFV